MKILITTGVYPPEIGGPATYSKLLFDELPKRGFGVEVLPFGEVRHLPKIIRHLVYFFKILKRGRRADIIYAQDPVSVGLPAMLANKILRKKFFIRLAGDYAWEQGVQRFGVKDNLDDFSSQQEGYSWRVQFLKKIQTSVAQSADVVIVPSHYFKTIIVNWGVNSEKIKVIYNGIKLVQPVEVEPPQVRGREEKVLLSVGRLVPWKGFKVLIEIMPDILREIPNTKLIIVGDGPQKAELEKIIAQLNLRNNVVLAGKLKRDEVLRFLQNADVFILNTQYEGFSHLLLEASYFQIPIITTNIGGNPELIENNQEGVLVEPDNKKEITEAIMKIFQDDDFRKKIIQNAWQKVQKFSIQNTLDELEKMLKI